MKIILFIHMLSIALLAECHPINEYKNDITIIESGELNCIDINNNEICIQRDVIKKNVAGSHEYHAICINGERVASGYPKLKNKTSKTNEWYTDKSFEVDTNGIIFNINNNTYSYNFQQTTFTKFDLPNNIIKFIPINDKLLAVQYLNEDNSTIKLMFFNKHTLEKHYIGTVNHAIFRKNIVIDILKHVDPEFINNYQNNNNTMLQTQQTSNNFLNLLSKNYDDPNKQYKKILVSVNNNLENHLNFQKNLNQDHNIQSTILNKSLEIVSKKSFQMDNDKYLKLLSSKFTNSPMFVHGNLSLVIVVITILAIIVSYLVLKYLVGGFTLPTVSSFFMLFYASIVVIGATFLNIFYFEYEYNTNLYERKDLLLNIWKYAVSGLLFIPLGIYVATLLFRYDAKKSFTMFTDQKIDYSNENKLFYISLFFMFISLTVLIIYIGKIGHIPIFGVFQNLLPEELAQLRSVAGNNFDGKVYRYMLFIKVFPILFLLISFMFKSTNKKWFLLFIAIFIYNIFVSIMDLQKAPIINILLLLLITHFYIIGKINWKQIALFLLLSIGLLFIMYVLFMGISREGLLQTLQNPFHRAFIGTVSPLFWWQLYVEQHGYLNGLSLPNPRHIFDFEHVKISVEIMEFVRPELKDIGVVGSMPAVFWADWFINFGVYTIFISMILFGFLIQSLDILFIAYIKNKKSILILALFIYILFYFKRYITTTYFGIIFDPNIILPIIFIVSLNYILQKIGKKKI